MKQLNLDQATTKLTLGDETLYVFYAIYFIFLQNLPFGLIIYLRNYTNLLCLQQNEGFACIRNAPILKLQYYYCLSYLKYRNSMRFVVFPFSKMVVCFVIYKKCTAVDVTLLKIFASDQMSFFMKIYQPASLKVSFFYFTVISSISIVEFLDSMYSINIIVSDHSLLFQRKLIITQDQITIIIFELICFFQYDSWRKTQISHKQFQSIDCTIISQMEQQTQHLNQFSTIYKKIEKDKKKASLKGLQLILQLNKQIGFDQILVRSAFAAYQNKKGLEAKRTQQSYLAFFNYVMNNINQIESNYLKDTNDAKLIEQAEQDNQKEYNFLLNKNSVSKFIRDQATHYQRIMEKYLVITNEGDGQKGIKTSNIHNFLIDLFTSKHAMIIKQNQDYLKAPIAKIQVEVGHHLLQYGKMCKQLSEQQAKHEYIISKEQILDFLTFWLKQESKLFILYARTSQRLNKQSKLMINQTYFQTVVHPSRMTVEEIVNKTEVAELEKPQQLANSEIVQKIDKPQPNIQNNDQQSMVPTHQSMPMKTQESRSQHQQRIRSQQKRLKKQISKEELLKREMKKLFEFGCKRRYKLNKNTTFQEISESSKTMNLQKFLYFCSFFQLNLLITRQLTTQYFKNYAHNMITLDFSGFLKTIEKMIAFDEKIRQNLLKKSKFQLKNKQNHIKQYKRAEGDLSSYKFMLYPINGKDINTIQKELTFRKLQKMIVREQKQKLAFNKREQLQKPIPKAASRILSNYSANKISAAGLQPIRDPGFNPQKLIPHDDNDKLWEAYEAKIWSKDHRSHSTLEYILSKRIERGNIIINKLNSQRSFIYDQ